MNARYLILLVLLCLIIPALSGATITITADRHDYYLPVGEPAEIPLTVTSDYAVSLLPGVSWWGFIYKGLSVVALYLVTMWLYGINEAEKSELTSLLQALSARLYGRGLLCR